jgi:hypothetical protein
MATTSRSRITDPTLRVCSLCAVDQTPLGKGLNYQANSRGHCIGLFCDGCCGAAREAVDEVAALHGACIVDGRYMSSPIGTPNLQSVEQLRAYAIARRAELKARARTAAVSVP